ncbi:hypothetical protein [Terriglobus aquaticus]|uniref:Uncharacterized protein n=1 Tax=Terriglobus aquaticus TaxID=940139 RepID=A0ABW9KGQ5_9BACT|nr:hypothetical protein [Terriglobus aquaticus]
MEKPEKILSPTVQPDTGLKIKIPDTEEGRRFLEDLKQLLKVEDLPFQKVCSTAQRPTYLDASAAPSSEASGSTTYSLDLRLEQEGWAP